MVLTYNNIRIYAYGVDLQQHKTFEIIISDIGISL